MGMPAFIATEGLIKGKIRASRSLPQTFLYRKKEPFGFWLWVSVLYAASLMCAVFLCLGLKYGFWTKHNYFGH
jgi:hypothetical protein